MMNYLQKKKLAFMSIVNRIKGFVRTITGTPPLVLPDCVGDDLINYSISGNSVQDGTPSPENPVEIESVGVKSKNLVNNEWYSRYGADIVINDNKVTFTYGAQGGTVWFWTYIPVEINKVYTCSFKSTVLSTNTPVSVNYKFMDEKITSWNYTEIHGGTTYSATTFSATATGKYLLLLWNSTQTGDSLCVENLQVEEINFNDQNLFDAQTFITLSGNSTYYSLNEDGELIQVTPDNIRANDKLPTCMTLSEGTYVVGGFTQSNYRFYNKTNGASYVNPIFTLQETSEIAFKSWNSTDTIIGKVSVVRLSEYEPYGYKIPITVRGKNLLKIEGRTEGTLEQGNIPIRQFEFDKYYTGWARNNQYYPWYTISHSIKENSVSIEPRVGWYGIGFPMKAKPNTTYYMSNLNKYQMGVGYYTKDGEYIGESAKNLFTTPNNCEIMVISCVPTTTGTVSVYQNIQVEEGEIATDYEPYVEPTETAIYLDEPLRKVGDVSDYIDFENGKIVRNVCERRVVEIQTDSTGNSRAKFDDGILSTNLIVYGSTAQRERYGITLGFISSDSKKMGTIEPQTKKGLCTALQVSNSLVATYPHIVFGWQSNVIYILNFSGTAESKAELNSELANIVNSTDFRILYLLATPTEELIKLPNMPLNKGTTILSIGTTVQPSSMSATYYSTSKE